MPRYDLAVCADQVQQLTLDRLAMSAGLHPSLVRQFVEFGLLQPIDGQTAAFSFDASDVLRLRVICRLRNDLGINLPGVAAVLDLLDRVRDLQRELESIRGKL